VKVFPYREKMKSGCHALGRFVVPGRTVERGRPYGSQVSAQSATAQPVASSPVPGECFHPGFVNCICDADAGTNRNSTVVLDHGTERLPVADICQPTLKTAAKQLPICFVDRDCAQISGHIVWGMCKWDLPRLEPRGLEVLVV
jgi:hypothetical protein